MGMARWAAAASVLALAVTGCGTAAGTGSPGVTPSSTLSAVPADCPGGKITGVGPESQSEPTQELLGSYAERCNLKSSVSYQHKDATESQQMFTNALSTWLSVQQPLPSEQAEQLAARCDNNPLWHLPTNAAPLAVTWNLPGVNELTLSPAVLARVLSGAITQWDDPALRELNPGVSLPAIPITPVLAETTPGINTTVSEWLTAAAGPEWPAGATPEWSGPGIRTESLLDSVSTVLGSPGTMSVLPLSYTRTNSLPGASIDFGSGPVTPTPQSASLALEQATIAEGNDLRLDPRYAGSGADGVPAEAYPLVVVGYQVVCSKGNLSNQGPLLRDFLSFWVTPSQQQALTELGMAPLPEPLRARVAAATAQLK